jgi:hypothetical protein
MKSNNAKTHKCDTDSPQRPCCWAARNAEFAAMRTPEAIAKQKVAAEAHAAKLEAEGGFITRGID